MGEVQEEGWDSGTALKDSSNIPLNPLHVRVVFFSSRKDVLRSGMANGFCLQ